MIPIDIAVNPTADTVYVVNYGSNTVSVIDGKTNAVVQIVPVGNNPRAITINPLTNSWYVANFRDNSIYISTGQERVKNGI